MTKDQLADDLLTDNDRDLITSVSKLPFDMGDIVHVRMGIQDMGDGLPPWIPGERELHWVQALFEHALPPNVGVVVTHFGVEIAEVLKSNVNYTEYFKAKKEAEND